MSLLENIVLKSQKINFDLSKSLNSNLIKENVNIVNNQFPIQPAQGEWIEEDNLKGTSKTVRRTMYFKQLAKFTSDHGGKNFSIHKNLFYKPLLSKAFEHVISIDYE